jgi:hypothetical protein
MHRGAREGGAMVRPTNVALVVRWRSTEEGGRMGTKKGEEGGWGAAGVIDVGGLVWRHGCGTVPPHIVHVREKRGERGRR